MTVETDVASSTPGTPDAWYRCTEASGNLANSGAESDFADLTVSNVGGSITYQTDTNADGDPAALETDGTGTNDVAEGAVANPSTHFTGKGSMIFLFKYRGSGTNGGSGYMMNLSDNTIDDDACSLGAAGFGGGTGEALYTVQDDNSSGDQWRTDENDMGHPSLEDGEWHTIGVTVTGDGPTGDNQLFINGVEYTPDFSALGTVDADWWPDEGGWDTVTRVVLLNRPIVENAQPIMRGMEFMIWADQRLTEAQHLEIHNIINPNGTGAPGGSFSNKTIRRVGRRLFSPDVP